MSIRCQLNDLSESIRGFAVAPQAVIEDSNAIVGEPGLGTQVNRLLVSRLCVLRLPLLLKRFCQFADSIVVRGVDGYCLFELFHGSVILSSSFQNGSRANMRCR